MIATQPPLFPDSIAPRQSRLRVLSMGWGVQSWCLAAMAIEGVIPKFDLIVHAGTREQVITQAFAERWGRSLEAAGMPVVTEHSAAQDDIDNPDRPGVFVPAFTLSETGSRGRLLRSCTGRWKVEVVRRVVRRELTRRNLARYGRDFTPSTGEVEMVLGISAEESQRAKPSAVAYAENAYPLLELGMSREDCIAWLRAHGYAVPIKSACIFCPFRSDGSWSALKATSPDDWTEALAVDAAIRTKRPDHTTYLHRSRQPLHEVELPTYAGGDVADFDNGMCGR